MQTPAYGGYQTPGDMPTQYVQRPQAVVARPTGGSSNMLYLVIGVLATALVGVGIYLFVSRDTEKRPEAASSNTTQTNTPAANAASPAAPANTMANAAPAPPNPALNPSGNWLGEIGYPSGSAFSAKATFSDTGNGQVGGQILWTLLRTTNPEKMGLTGSSATEFVRGTFDAATRTLTVAGYDTDDHSGHLIIMDKYRLTMSPDGHSLSGFSFGGKTHGRITLRK
jgi:hypothetical protein